MCISPLIFFIGFILTKLFRATFWELAPIFAMLGVRMSLVMASVMNVMMTAVPPEKARMASRTIRTL